MKTREENMNGRETYEWVKEQKKESKGVSKELLMDHDVEFWKEPRKENDEFSHIYRHKTWLEMIRISAAMMGIQLSNAIKTSFVSPTLLKIGVEHRLMTIIWCISPALGLFMTPVLGALSDNCTLKMGRRRPFILILSIGLISGLILFPNGKLFGILLGDTYAISTAYLKNDSYLNNSTVTFPASSHNATILQNAVPPTIGNRDHHPWGIFLTILGLVLLDFHADACQSPARSYLMDVTLPEDHAEGQSVFTLMAGFGGGIGYAIGAINWDDTILGQTFGGHLQAVFMLVLFIYIICVTITITSFNEIPIGKTNHIEKVKREKVSYMESEDSYREEEISLLISQNAADLTDVATTPGLPQDEVPDVTLKHYLLSIVYMPKSLHIILLTNFFSWNSLLCYTLYFTDFVGEAVFNGDPLAPKGSQSRISFEEGVRFGCWGMFIYSITSVVYSAYIKTLVQKCGAKAVYVWGQLVNSLGLVLMVFFPHKAWVTLFSATAGVMYTTLFTMPYIILSNYHEKKTVGFGHPVSSNGTSKESDKPIRGMGTDVAIVSSMLFLAQIVQSLFLGFLVQWFGSTAAIMVVASFFAFCGAVVATQVVYLDL